jgi:hypothetical protein
MAGTCSLGVLGWPELAPCGWRCPHRRPTVMGSIGDLVILVEVDVCQPDDFMQQEPNVVAPFVAECLHTHWQDDPVRSDLWYILCSIPSVHIKESPSPKPLYSLELNMSFQCLIYIS